VSTPAAKQLVVSVFAACCALGPCARVQAFQNPARFTEDPVESGGGGKRFFTGSPADGYTCKVCHAPGKAVHIDITGLPFDGYVPGKTYPFVIDWPDDLEAVGLNAEFTDQAGAVAGELTAPPASQLMPQDLCSAGRISGALVIPFGSRSVLLLGECGQHQTTLLWKAPTAAPSGPVWFSGSLVVSDSKGDVAGDRVTDFRHALPPEGAASPATTAITRDATCAISGPRAHARSVSSAWLAVVAGWYVRRRKLSARRDTTS
jgi:hypothetical protein